MRTGRWSRTLAALAAIFVLLAALPAQAIDVSVTATVPSPIPPEPPPTAVIFKGIAYPSSTVTIQKDGVTAVQVPADPQARFDITVGSLSAGTYTFGVFATDSLSRQSPTSSFTVTLTTGTTVTITGIFLGPTIVADRTSLTFGETVTVFGATSPSSTVHVFVSSDEEREYTTTAGTDGLWTKQLFADDLKAGDHVARSKAEESGGMISEFSNSVAFTVASITDPDAGYIDADINKDKEVNIIDFSILLFYWQQKNPANARADINHDSTVNIIDFSVMLYFWTGQK